MKRLTAPFFAAIWLASLLAGSPAVAAGRLLLAGAGGGGGACSQYTAFIARVAAQSANYQAAYKAFICGGVTDGWWAKIDASWLEKAHEAATAQTNLVSSSYGLVVHGSPVFTANVGYTATETGADYLDTQFNPTTAVAPNYSTNSASLGGSVNSTSTSVNQSIIGTVGGGYESCIEPLFQSSAVTQWRIRSGVDINSTEPASLNGSYFASRTDANTSVLYKDGASLATNGGGVPSLQNVDFVLLLGCGGDGGTGVITSGFIGGGLTAGDVTNLTNRLNTFLASVP